MSSRSLSCLIGRVALVALMACQPQISRLKDSAAPLSDEISPILLPLTGSIASRQAEISGFAWAGDELIALPQRPAWSAACPQGCFYALSRAAIERAIDGDPAPLSAREIPLKGWSLVSGIEGLQGGEALAIVGKQIFVLLEAKRRDGRMVGQLALGHIEGGERIEAIVIDSIAPVELPAQVHLDNIAYESLLPAAHQLIAIFEANGRLNAAPRAMLLDERGHWIGAIPFPHIEYRITDVTPLEPDGSFWALNYFFPPEAALAAIEDPRSPPHVRREGQAVERILRLRLQGGRVTLAPQPPVILRLSADGRPRNWEALATIGDRGFLLATDKHPATMLAFVPFHR